MKKTLPLFFVLLFGGILHAQEVINVESQDTTPAFILNIGFQGAIRVSKDVQNYKLTYTTTDPFGQPDTATGFFCFPVQIDGPLPLVVYNHGTVGAPDEVPSVVGVPERFIAQAFAANDFVALAPDYLGLGDSDGIHPYLHADTEASAGRDMILAVKDWLFAQNVEQNGQLFTTGYSQGGHASMALHRDIETMPGDDGLTVSAAAHLSGAYFITAPSPLILGLAEVNPTQLSFFINTLLSYNFVYDLYGPVDSLFQEPYLTEVERFLGDEIDLYEMGNQLDTLLRSNSAIVGEMFSEAFVTDVLDNDPTLLNAYTQNNTATFAPSAPTLLYYCNADLTVSPTQSVTADSVMRALGADSLFLVDGGPLDHGPCAIPAAIAALNFFSARVDGALTSLGEVVVRPGVRLAPNPVSAGATLRISGLPAGPKDFIVYDFSGRIAANGVTLSDGSLRLPATLRAGTYVVRLELDGETSVARRLVVK